MIKLCRDSIHNKLCNTRPLRKVPSSNLITDNRDAEKVTETNIVEIKGCGLSSGSPEKSQRGAARQSEV
jgi:hypothetical protein